MHTGDFAIVDHEHLVGSANRSQARSFIEASPRSNFAVFRMISVHE